MAAANLTAAIEPAPLGPEGADRVELMLRANRGEEAKPLARIASGGELSRIMLALKLALRRADPVATYVFDEVDAGIGGQAAEVVGQKMRQVASHRQVLCVTHLPTIAALAHHHFVVAKAEVGGRTETSVRQLEGADRRDEIARMMSGAAVTAPALAHAEAMLAAAADPAGPTAAAVTTTGPARGKPVDRSTRPTTPARPASRARSR
jgi:DNA repair protein RecN (Recombination protein N)